MHVLCLRLERKANAICSLMPKVVTRQLLYLSVCWEILASAHHFLLIMDHTCMSAMIQQPRIPSYGMMQASDVVIRAKEVRAMALFLVAPILEYYFIF